FPDSEAWGVRQDLGLPQGGRNSAVRGTPPGPSWQIIRGRVWVVGEHVEPKAGGVAHEINLPLDEKSGIKKGSVPNVRHSSRYGNAAQDEANSEGLIPYVGHTVADCKRK